MDIVAIMEAEKKKIANFVYTEIKENEFPAGIMWYVLAAIQADLKDVQSGEIAARLIELTNQHADVEKFQGKKGD